MRMIKRSSLPFALGLVLSGAPAFAQDSPPSGQPAPMNAPGQKGSGAQGQGQMQGEHGKGMTGEGTTGQQGQAGQEEHAAGNLAPQDQQFVQQAALDNLFEVRLGQLALEKAQSKTARDFASRMVKDHSSAMTNLNKIAQKQGIQVPSKITDEQQAIYDRLSQMSGKDFDTAYMEQVTQQHQTAMNVFQRQSEEGQNKDLRDYAKNTISTLRKHQDLARRDSKKL